LHSLCRYQASWSYSNLCHLLALRTFPIGNTINVTANELGLIVRQERIAQGLRQDQLAAASGVGLRFLIELEAGKPTVQLAKVLQVLTALGCSINVTRPAEA
jgi:y4mF family transcriptional regulator